MAQSPWKQGDLLPYWDFELIPDSGPLDITGLVATDFILVFINSAGVARDGDGVFTGLSAASGESPAQITYRQSAADVATLGIFDRRVVIKRGTAQQRTFELGSWVCER